jgi:4-alpha-glucanotransferase
MLTYADVCCRHSVDVWLRADLFRTDKLAGSPPDSLTERGQNWKMPLYDWDRMARDKYAWLRGRLKAAYTSSLRPHTLVA